VRSLPLPALQKGATPCQHRRRRWTRPHRSFRRAWRQLIVPRRTARRACATASVFRRRRTMPRGFAAPRDAPAPEFATNVAAVDRPPSKRASAAADAARRAAARRSAPRPSAVGPRYPEQTLGRAEGACPRSEGDGDSL
jgi:hypothetical protein